LNGHYDFDTILVGNMEHHPSRTPSKGKAKGVPKEEEEEKAKMEGGGWGGGISRLPNAKEEEGSAFLFV
jgi:hypothetical protein